MANYDLSYLNELFVEDREAIKEIAISFITYVPIDTASLKEAFALRDYENMRLLCHKLKSSLTLFQIEPARTNLANIEKAIKSKKADQEKIKIWFDEAIIQIEESVKELTIYVS
jgi:HPt (histidine-containing phosphotransfer) domain-containing protein